MCNVKNSKAPLRLGLQFFGEDVGAETGEQSGEPPLETEASVEKGDVTEREASPNVEDLIKRAVDRATNKLGNDNKMLKEQLDKVSREKLSSDELKQLEAAEREAILAQRESQIIDKENRYYAIKAIKAAGLDTGDETALQLIDFVMGQTCEDIDSRVETFARLLNKLVKTGVDSTFKENGRIPDKSSATKSGAQANIGTTLGKMSLATNTASKAALDYYLGGKK